MSTSTDRYAHGHHESVLKSHSWRTIDNSAAYLAEHLEPGMSLLDVGCGPGTITVEFADRLAPGRVVGVDAAAEVIARAAELGAGRENLEFAVADAYALPFEDGSFDIVHAHQLLHHLGDPVAALREFRRVTKPGGLVAVREVDYAGTFWFPLLPGLAEWAALYQRVHRSNSGDPDAGRRLKAWARQAGFDSITSTGSHWTFSDAADREWWGSMWQARVLESAFAEDALTKGFADREALQRISRTWRAWADDEDAWLFMPHGQVLCRA